VNNTLSSDVKIGEIAYAAGPSELSYFSGCVELAGKLVLWGDELYPNRLLLSDPNKPDVFANIEERYSPPFGGSEIIRCVVTTGDYLVVFKETGIYLWDGVADKPLVINNTIGIGGPHTAKLITSGDKTLKEDEVRSIVMFQNKDGVYKLSVSTDSYLITKVSEQIADYFKPAKSAYIGDSYINDLSAEYEPVSDTYRLFLSDRTLVYSIGTDEWYPYWDYALVPTCGLSCVGPSDDNILLYGTDEGHILIADEVTTDRSTSNAATKIEHEIKTRPIFLSEENFNAVTGTLREIWTEMLEDTGAIIITLYTNRETTGSELSTPLAPSLSNSDVSVIIQRFDMSSTEINCFQLKFASSTLNQKMEIYSFDYHYDQLLTYE